MLSDLGLHELVSTAGTTKATRTSKKESDLAYALLSACIIYEGVWTLYLGRPSSIPKSVMSIAASRCKAERESDSPWLNAWVGLCVPMAEISEVLNDQSIAKSQRISLLRQLFNDVEEWHKSLPPALAYKENGLIGMDPAGYGLHTQFCKVQILVRRALAQKTNPKKRRYVQMMSDEDTQNSPDESQITIHQCALRTARLVVTYREAFGLEKIPSIMLDNAVVAATAMMQNLDRADAPNGTQQQTVWLRQLLKSLELVQPHFPIVRRMLDSLKNVSGRDPASSGGVSTTDPTVPSHSEPLPEARQPSDLQTGPIDIDDKPVPSNTHDTEVFWENFDLDRAMNDFTEGGFDDPILPFIPEIFMSSLTSALS